MPNAILWDAAASLTTYGSTALNSLAAGASSGVLDEIDNSAGLYTHIIYQLELGAAYSCGTGSPRCDIYHVYALDGTNYPNPPSGTGSIPGHYWVGAISAVASANFTRGHSLIIPILPAKLKPIVVNNLNTSGSWNATGNTLKATRGSLEIQ
jgi:hypothetical protein